jgi:hypothetical protein
MFECYNLLDPMEWGAAIFLRWFRIRQVQDPLITSLNSHTLILWEIDFSSYVKNCRVWLKKIQGILGAK